MPYCPPPFSYGTPPPHQRLSALATGTARCPDTLDHDHPTWANWALSSPRHCLVTDRTQLAGKNVLVIGGGFSGLATAWELIRCGINVTVLDGSQRCDEVSTTGSFGRAYTRHLQDPSNTERQFTCEMGAAGFPVGSKLFWYYLKHLYQMLKPEFLPLGDRDPNIGPCPVAGIVPTAILCDGRLETFNGQPPPGFSDFLRDRLGQFFRDLAVTDGRGLKTSFEDVQRILKQTDNVTPQDLDRVAFFWSTMIDRYDNQSLEEVLRAPTEQGGLCLSPDQVRIFAAVGYGTGGFAAMLPLGFLTTLRLNLWAPGALMTPPPGLTVSGVAGLLRLACDKANVIGHESEQWGTLDFRENTTATSVLWDRSSRLYEVEAMDVDGAVTVLFSPHVVVATSPRAFQTRLNLDRPTPATSDGVHQGVFETSPDMVPRLSAELQDIVQAMGEAQECPASLFYSVIRKPWYVAPGQTTPLDPDWPTVRSEPVKVLVSDTLARTTVILDPFPDSPFALAKISEAWGTDASKLHAAKLYIRNQIPYASPSRPGIAENEFYAKSFDGYASPSNRSTPFRLAARLRENTDSSLMSALAWELVPLAHSGATLQGPGDHQKLTRLAFQHQMCMDTSYAAYRHGPDQTSASSGFYLAGEGCSFLGGWVEGALTAGMNAALAVIFGMNRAGDLPPNVRAGYATPSRYRRRGATLRPVQVCSYHQPKPDMPPSLNYASILPEKATPLRPAMPIPGETNTNASPYALLNWRNSTFIFFSRADRSLRALRIQSEFSVVEKHTIEAAGGYGPPSAVVYDDRVYVFYQANDSNDVNYRYLDTSTTPWSWQPGNYVGSWIPETNFKPLAVATPFGLYLFSISPDFITISAFRFINNQWLPLGDQEVIGAEHPAAVEINGAILIFFLTPETPRRIGYQVFDAATGVFDELGADWPHLVGSDGAFLRAGAGFLCANNVDGDIAVYYPSESGGTVAATFRWSGESRTLSWCAGPVAVEAVRADASGALAVLTGDIVEPDPNTQNSRHPAPSLRSSQTLYRDSPKHSTQYTPAMNK